MLSGHLICYSEVDDEFLSGLDVYVNDGIINDIKSMHIRRAHAGIPDGFRQLMMWASSGIVDKLDNFTRRMKVLHKFLDQCNGHKSEKLDQDGVCLVCIS